MNWDALLQVLEHNERVTQGVLSPDSSLIALLSSRKVAIWRSQTGNCVHELKFDSSTTIATSMEFSCDFKLLYVAFSNGEVTSWETDAWTCRTVIEGDTKLHSDVSDSLAFSHDAALLAMGRDFRKIEIRSADTGERIWAVDAHTGYISSLSFSHDSTLLVSSSGLLNNGSLRIWRMDTGACIRAVESSVRHIDGRSLRFSPDASHIACGSYRDNKLLVWQVNSVAHARNKLGWDMESQNG
ncbi:hypothetical protein TrVGV298_002257 [Trichoderma virens]|nr:hypothetical protein TrVGV298_002257 [Trichoderma virens]